MKTKLTIFLIVGILCISLGIADLSIGITPKKETFDTQLPTIVKERLDDEIRFINWSGDVNMIDDGDKANGLLTWEWFNGTDWIGKEKRLYLWINYDVESKRCLAFDEYGKCTNQVQLTHEEMVQERMLQKADVYFLKTYKKLPDVVNVDVEDVGVKDIRLVKEITPK